MPARGTARIGRGVGLLVRLQGLAQGVDGTVIIGV